MSSPSVYGFLNPATGTSAGPTNPGMFGLNVPRLGFPGEIGNQNYGYGLPSSMDPHANIELEGRVTLTANYVSPPVPDMGDLLLASGIPAFAIREKIDIEEDGITGLTLIVSLPQVNKLFADQSADHIRQSMGTEQTNPYFDYDHSVFRGFQQNYGEAALEAYAMAYRQKNRHLLERYSKGCPDIGKYFEMATEDGFCYLTTYGILQKLNFLGVILSTNRADSGYDNESAGLRDGFTSVGMAVGQRAECAQLFGPNCEAVVGSPVYLTLTRVKCGPEYKPGTFGRFIIVPRASATHPYLPAHCTTYTDESGRMCRGHVWYVGTITEPAEREPSKEVQELATGRGGTMVTPQRAYDAQGLLPTCYLALGI